VLLKQAQVKAAPGDGETWGMLGKLYKQLALSSRRRGFRSVGYTNDSGVQTLIQLSLEAYGNAVRLKPLDPLWHAGYADLLAYYSYYAGSEGLNTQTEALRSMQEIKTALSLAPNDTKVLEIANEMVFFLDSGMVKNGDTFDYPWLTATPVPSATAILLPVSSSTPAQLVTLSPILPGPTPTITRETSTAAGKSPPICGGALILPLFGMFWINQISKKHKFASK
jgi:hypothetical protein